MKKKQICIDGITQTYIVGPDDIVLGLDHCGIIFSSKFRWVAQLFDGDKQVNKAEFVRVKSRPQISDWKEGFVEQVGPAGEVEITFFRDNVEIFDKIWLGLYSGGQFFEEWTLNNVRLFEVVAQTLEETNAKYKYNSTKYKSCC